MDLGHSTARTLEEWIVLDVRRQISAEHTRLERDCAEALALTPTTAWVTLHIVHIDRPLGASRIPAAVACSWPFGW